MQHRFFDILVESENGQDEIALDREFILDVPEHDMSTAIERLEHVGVLLDTITAASGCAVCSFRSEPLTSIDLTG
jgi:hypothetical protein